MCGPLLAVARIDNKPVYFLSTIHPPEFSQHTQKKKRVVRRRGAGEGGATGDVACPPLLTDYNKYMGGVDESDQMLRYYTCIRKTVTWYPRVLFHEVEEAIQHACILECCERECTASGLRTALDSRLEPADSLIYSTRREGT